MLISCRFFSKLEAGFLLLLLLVVLMANIAQAATYNLSSGSYPVCNNGGSWSVSGSTYTCSTKVVLATGDIVTANSGVTLYAQDGFSLASNTTIGSASANINLISNYGTITSSGAGTVYGTVNAGSGVVTLNGTAITGSLTSTGNINLTGGSVAGLVTSSSNTITTNGTNLGGGATAQSGMTITGGTLAGNFTMTANNQLTMSGVTMTSGSISGASTVNIQSGSVLGSSTSAISISSTSGAITVNNSTVYGNLTAPSYSTVNVNNGAQIYGTCTPGSTPANACSGSSANVCPAGLSSGITGYYFNNTSLTEPSVATRLDGPINFSWGSGAPGPTGVNADAFSVRWSGYVRATTSGVYRFQTTSDDGVRLYVNGNLVINRWNDHSSTTDTSADISLVAGQAYTLVLEYYENAGDAVIQLRWLLPGASAYVAIPQGPSSLGAGLYECIPAAKPPVSSCSTSLTAGITGDYFNNQTLTAPVTSTRLDGPINFDWSTGAPGPTGVGANNFSIRWNGYVRVSQSGLYRFQTNSDDGVRLTVNGDLLIDQWNDHSVTTHTSTAVNLTAGNAYPIKMEYYENSGYAVAQLLWQLPTGGSYVAIPKGSTPVSSAGLYECVSTPGSYTITNSASGLTCAAEAVTVTALNTSGAVYNPPAGTVVTVGTTPATGVWVGGNSYTFSGGESSFTKYLQQTTPATLTINANSTTATGSSSITFADVGLKIADNFTQTPPANPPGVVNQISGVTGTARLKVIRKDNNTGACVAQVGAGNRDVSIAYSCVNPTSCVTGQTFTVNAINVPGSNNVAPTSYSTVTLAFDSSGEAPMSINYSDAGQVRLYGQMTITGSSPNPTITLTGSSDLFVVKPQSIVVSSVQRANGTANPGGTSAAGAAAQFVAAGDQFRVFVEARNGASPSALTPNFGRELTPATQNLKIRTKSLVYPSTGTTTSLTVSGSPSTTTPQGTFLFSDVRWYQVGSITIEPQYDDSYLGAGTIANMVASSTVGRFYPDHFAVSGASLADTCTATSFSYMGQPIPLTYTVDAKASDGLTTASNYGALYLNNLAANYPALTYAAESENSGVDLGARFSDGITKTWSNGSIFAVAPNAVFNRLTVSPYVDGPYTNTQIGLKLTDSFDVRSIKNMDMNANSTGACSSTGCTAKALGSAVNLRYGRLRLDDAFGPESTPLPVNFYTEYWIGNRFVKNTNDGCTKILLSAIRYPAGSILTPANRTVALDVGSTTGSYSSVDATYVNFTNGDAKQSFSAPTGGGKGAFNVNVDLTASPWLSFDWNQDGNYADTNLPTARFGFGSYRGNDRVIYWREMLQ